MNKFDDAARDLGLENDPLISALSSLLRAQDAERERTIAEVNGLVRERRATAQEEA